jgi:poly(A) polymerase/tRNA nucleotidyltransferase (CCA-adding enzyme)
MRDERAAAIDAALAAVLPAGALYAVGGRVRDEIRSELDGVPRPAKDLDYVVLGVGRDELIERLRRAGPADVVGAAFAVVKVAVLGESVDVALPRRERSTGLGHRDFQVDSGPDIPLEDDLARRDFRMNMMARRVPDGAVVDPYGGTADVRAGRIDLLRDEAFAEDPLRMLRACQFAARFRFEITERTMNAMRAAAPLVATVSPERVRDELAKFVAGADRPSLGIEWMRLGGLLPLVLPEVAEGIGVEQNEFHAYDVYRHNLETMDAVPPGDLTLRLAALFHDVAKPRTKDGPHFYRHEIVGAEMAAGIAERLRLPNDMAGDVVRLVRHHMYAADPAQEPRTIRRFIRRVGVDLLERQFALRAADIRGSGLPKRGPENEQFQARVAEVLAERPALSVKDLAVGGNDAIAALVEAGRLPRGSRGGREVGVLLGRLLEFVTDDPERNERTRLLAELRVEAMRLADDVSRETAPG